MHTTTTSAQPTFAITRVGHPNRLPSGKVVVRVWVDRGGCIEDTYDVHVTVDDVTPWPAYRTSYGSSAGSAPALVDVDEEAAVVGAAVAVSGLQAD